MNTTTQKGFFAKTQTHTAIPLLLLLLFCLVLLSGCADGVPLEVAANMEKVGFWSGLWHGLILPFSFIVSLFSDSTAIYATYNNGGWYDAGFLLGACSSLGGGGSASCRRRR